MNQVLRNSCQTSFESAAHSYLENATVQKEVAKDLLKIIKPHLSPALKVLEIGSGTGILTSHLLEEEQSLNLTCQDFSRAMIDELSNNLTSQLLRSTSFEHLDMDKDLPKEKFSLVVSSSCLHWSKDLSSLLKRLKSCLDSSGQIIFSMMIKGTFKEIEESVSQIKDFKFDYNTKPCVLTSLSSAGFEPEVINEKDYFEFYESFKDLINSLKLRGVSKFKLKGSKEVNSYSLLPKEFMKAAVFYENSFKACDIAQLKPREEVLKNNRVYARYRVLTCKASLTK